MSSSVGVFGLRRPSPHAYYLGQLSATALMLAGAMVFCAAWAKQPIQVIGFAGFGAMLLFWGGWLRYHYYQWQRKVIPTERAIWLSQRGLILVGGAMAALCAALLCVGLAALCLLPYQQVSLAIAASGAFGLGISVRRMRYLYLKRLSAYRRNHQVWG